ncbi:MAG TPA: glycosyltransferase, partial [Pirellulaceae bacterium]|nr:glycosyltransferase [Pirellulaceae bacterium]
GPRDLAQRSFQIKREALAGRRLHVVAPSVWLADQARQSHLLGNAASIRVIPYGLDTVQFSPTEKALARQQLGLPQDRFVIGFGATSLTQHRKGMTPLLAALAQLERKSDIVCVAFGGGGLPWSGELPEIHSVGFLRDPGKLALVYSAADVFALPSLEDNLPQTGLEALACGTPVVGFATGGIPDFVHPGETGLLARRGDAGDLAAQIQRLRDRADERVAMGSRGRRLVLERFSSEREASQYIALYGELRAERAARPTAA